MQSAKTPASVRPLEHRGVAGDEQADEEEEEPQQADTTPPRAAGPEPDALLDELAVALDEVVDVLADRVLPGPAAEAGFNMLRPTPAMSPGPGQPPPHLSPAPP